MSVVWSILYVVYMGIMLAGYTTMWGRVAATTSCICLRATYIFCLGYIVGKEKKVSLSLFSRHISKCWQQQRTFLSLVRRVNVQQTVLTSSDYEATACK